MLVFTYETPQLSGGWEGEAWRNRKNSQIAVVHFHGDSCSFAFLQLEISGGSLGLSRWVPEENLSESGSLERLPISRYASKEMLHTSREQIYTSREQIYTSREQLRISREELTSSREQISSTAEERLSSSVDELRTSGVNFSGSDPPTAEEKLDIRPEGFRWVTMSTCVPVPCMNWRQLRYTGTIHTKRQRCTHLNNTIYDCCGLRKGGTFADWSLYTVSFLFKIISYSIFYRYYVPNKNISYKILKMQL